jgi:hypothetical protein
MIAAPRSGVRSFDEPIFGRYIRFPRNDDLSGDASEASAGTHPFHYFDDNLDGTLSVASLDIVTECSDNGLCDSLSQLCCCRQVEVGLTREVRAGGLPNAQRLGD